MSERTKEQRVQDLEVRLKELRDSKDKSSPEFQKKQGEVSRDLHASIDRGDLDTKTPRNGAVFYDNGNNKQVPEGAKVGPDYNANSNRARAVNFCKQPGNEHCTTLEQTGGGKWMNDQKLYEGLPPKDADKAWGKLSGQYAKNASGEAHAFVRTDSAEHRVFKSTEQRELQNNPNVTRLNYHHNQHGIEMTHHQHLRPAPPERPQASAAASGPPPRGSTPQTATADAPSKGRSR